MKTKIERRKGNKRRIILIGDGAVGSSFAFASVLKGTGRELGIMDVNKNKAYGDVLDLEDALVYSEPKHIFVADYEDCKEADIVIIAAGVPQKDKNQSRLELLTENIILFNEIVTKVMASGFNGIFVIASNPVDILSYATWKFSGLPHNQVIGTGTSLDTARFRYELSDLVKVDTRNVHIYILGEHGDSEFPAWSVGNVGGLNFGKWLDLHPEIDRKVLNEIFETVRDKAYKIIENKRATYYGIAASLNRIVKAILNDENSILPISTYLDGQYGLEDIYIGTPAILGKHGVVDILELPLNEEELQKYKESASKLKEAINAPFKNIKEKDENNNESTSNKE